MKNTYMLMIYIPMAVAMMVMVFFLLRKKAKTSLDKNMLLMVLSLFGWQMMLILYNLTSSDTAARFFYDMDLPFVALSVVAYVLFIARFYGIDSYFPKVVVGCLFVIPAFTTIVAVTSKSHTLLRSSFEILETRPAHIVEVGRGPWFWVHAGFCYILIVAVLVVSLFQHWKLPRIYRTPSILLLIGIFGSAAANIFVLFGNAPFDLSLLSITLASVLLFLAAQRNRGILFVRRAKKEVFHYLNRAILILDDDEKIVYVNRPAEKLMADAGIENWEDSSFLEFFAEMAGDVDRIEVLEDEESGADYYQKSGSVLNVRQRPMLDRKGGNIGAMVALYDATENRRLIQNLEDIAGIDVLTGLFNRRHAYEALKEFDQEKKYPLSVIIGDLNNLKKVNDTLGHPQGDLLLRVSAEALMTCCPPRAHVARIGGDEFMVLIPNFSAEQAAALVADIKKAFFATQHLAFQPSMALGYAVKQKKSEEMERIIDAADIAMYHDKLVMKTGEFNQ